MKIEIKSAQEWSTLEKARQDCVVTSALYAYLIGTHFSTPDWAVMVWEGEEMVSNVHIIERTATVGGRPVKLGGIGNIATKIEWRKRGYATEALKVAVDFLRDPLGVDFGLMTAIEKMVPRYERTGWSVVGRCLHFEQPGGEKGTFTYPVLILPVQQSKWPQGEIDLCGLPW
jgi:predicted acetyltransferase